MSDQTKPVVPASEPTGCLGGVVRVAWLGVGNGALLFLALGIAQQRAFPVLDLTYWAVVVGLIAIRYLDITKLHGLTSNGEPASLQHWRRYAIFLILASAAVWLVAHGVVCFTAS